MKNYLIYFTDNLNIHKSSYLCQWLVTVKHLQYQNLNTSILKDVRKLFRGFLMKKTFTNNCNYMNKYLRKNIKEIHDDDNDWFCMEKQTLRLILYHCEKNTCWCKYIQNTTSKTMNMIFPEYILEDEKNTWHFIVMYLIIINNNKTIMCLTLFGLLFYK